MLSNKNLSKRIDQIIELANHTLATKQISSGSLPISYVNSELFNEFRSSALSFIINLYGENHPYYKDFNQLVVRADPHNTEKGRGILKSIKSEIDEGWLITLKGIVSAEIFSDFMEMAEHLLNQGYKDPAAVMSGSVLEEHLRQLCKRNSIEVESIKDEKPVSKKADLLNSELAAANIYNKLDQKSITSWLDLRNKAAHGKYSEYTKEQVDLMYWGITNFISRTT